MGPSESELTPNGHGVTYAPLPVRSLLNRSQARRVAMEFTINPYRGCEFGCRYCYARYTHQYLDHPDPEHFERQIYAKLDAPTALARDLARTRIAGRQIAIGTATDPYQPLERRLGITRGVLETLCGCRGARISLVTKSDLVVRDRDVLVRLAERHDVSIAFTLLTLDRSLLRRLEPRAPTPAKRLAAMCALAEAGLRVGLSYAPVLPAVNDGVDAMDSVLAAVAEAGAAFAFCQPLWVSSCARTSLFQWLKDRFPEHEALYRRLFRHGVDLPDALRAALRERFAELAAIHGLSGSLRCDDERPVQLSLFEW